MQVRHQYVQLESVALASHIVAYDVVDLAENTTFEEVAYLLLKGKLPNSQELKAYIEKLKTLRGLQPELRSTLEGIPKTAHPMDVLRTGCSVLGNLEQEEGFINQADHADRMLSAFPSILSYWYQYSHYGKRIDTETNDDTIGGHFLHLLHGKKPSQLHDQVMSISLILYAEHEFNASTFSCKSLCLNAFRYSFCCYKCYWDITRTITWRR